MSEYATRAPCVLSLCRVLAIVSSALHDILPSITVSLRDGTSVRVRPVQASDRDQLVRGFEGLSEAARYQRFFTSVTRLTGSQLRYLTNLDQVNHFAWGAETIEGDGIAIARYVRTADDVAEAAFTIADDYQGRGLGSFLLLSLGMVAASNGIERFEMTMLADNIAMARLARNAAAVFDAPSGGTVRAELELVTSLWADLAEGDRLLALAAATGPAA